MKEFTINRNRGYWLAISVISVVVGVLIHIPELTSLVRDVGRHNLFPNIQPEEVAVEIGYSIFSMIVLYLVCTYMFKYNKVSVVINGWKFFLSFLVCLLFSRILSNVFYYLHNWLDIPAVHATLHFYLHPVRDVIISVVVSGSCYIMYLIFRQQYINKENQQLRMENIRNQYEALKNQLNPHMLFNSLNTLRALIREAPEKAQDYTLELSNVMRYMLHDNASKSVTLAEELEFVKAYTFILKMRYEDTLYFEMDIDNRYANYLLPPMSLQLLIENAVKHNEISMRNPLRIEVKTTANDSILVRNRRQPKLTNTSGPGIGLDNLARRYHLFFEKEIEIVADTDYFCVTIPLIKPAEDENIDS